MNCEKCRAGMSDAATDGLSVRQRAEFEAHVQECAGCREEFTRTQTLFEAIDRGVMAQGTVEPSPEFVARVRRRIAAEGVPARANWPQRAPVAAAVAVAVVAGGLWMMRAMTKEPRRVATNAPAFNQPVAVTHSAPHPSRKVVNATAPEPKPDFATVSRSAMPKRPWIERQPEVLIPPGQNEALLQFVNALRSGKLDGAKLIAEQQKANQLIEIKPLVISPLDSSKEEANKGSGPESGGTQKDFVSAESIR